MSDKNKTNAQLIEEMAALRERNAELESQQAEHQRTEQVQSAFYRIADAASAVEDMQEFYATIHQIVGELVVADNFYIALYDETRQLMNVPYEVDSANPGRYNPQVWEPVSKSVTSYVLRTGQFVDMEKINELIKQGEIVFRGNKSVDGIAIPLTVDGRIVGMLAVQGYTEDTHYTEQDKKLLNFVAQHIATALERARLLDDTRQRNAELAIINSVGEGLAKQVEFQAIIDLVGDKIREIISADGLNIALYDAESNMINFPYFYDGDTRIFDEPRPLEGGFIATIIETGQPVVISTRKELFDRKGVIPEHRRDSLPEEFSWLGVPISIGQEITGTIYILKFQNHAFTVADVQLLSTIAGNMGVALENARLFDELQTRNREIAEALQQQTATGEILRAMAGSLSDVQPVFDAIAKNAANLGGTAVSTVYRYDGELLHIVAMHNLPPENVAAVRKAYPRPLTRDVGLSAMSIIDRTAYNIADVEQDPRVPPHMVKITRDAGMRSTLFVPMIRQNVAIGAIGIGRREAGAFTEKQVALLNTFANQAIIAIENVELFNETKRLLAETQQRNAELAIINSVGEGLAKQLEYQAIIDLVGDKIREIFKADTTYIVMYDPKVNLGAAPYYVERGHRHQIEPEPPGTSFAWHIIETNKPLLFNTLEEQETHSASRLTTSPGTDKDLNESYLGVPIHAGESMGALSIQSYQQYAYSQSDFQLLGTIAANLGVALENARLFDEIQRTNQDLSQTLKELRRTQGQLVEAEKMAALGGLVAGVAHEINTPVGVGVTAASTLQDKTSGFSEIYKSGQMKRSDLEKYLDLAEQSSAMILRNLERAAELIQSFKQVAVDQSSEERRQFRVKAYLEEILLSLRPKLKKTQLTIEINGDDSLTLDSYPGAFSQIVTNLVMNSLLHAYEPDDQGQLTFDLRQSDGRLIFEYNDDGKGIPQENLSKIFEPFFTTKRTQGGSGLGLHIIYNLVTQRLGGAIHCESEVGSGTKFVIAVPVS